MTPYLLNLVYIVVLAAVSPWLLMAAVRKGKYREGFGAKLLGLAPRRRSEATCLWLHAVSVGEVNLLEPLIAEISRRRPEWECVVSTTTRTGYALAKKKFPSLSVFYCPLDFSWAVRGAMRRVRPTCLVLAELELWPNLIRAARELGARVAIINGRLGDASFRGYRRLRPFVARMLKQIDLIAAQNEEYAERFRALGAPADRVRVTGSMKFDGARTDRNNARTVEFAQLAGFTSDDVVWLAGSTQEPEERIALGVYQTLAREFPRLRLVLVPRHPERFDAVADMLAQSGVAWRRRGELEPADGENDARVLLVDAMGELGAWWGAARIAFVGGSLGNRGGQNMIEPAAYGAAVAFGPNTRNFRDIVAAMLAQEAAVVVRDEGELADFVRRCLAEPEFAQRLGARAQALVRSQIGAVGRTLDDLERLLEPAGSRAERAIAVARGAA